MLSQEVLCPPLPNPGAPACSLGPHLAIYVGFGPGDVVVVVDDHGPAKHMQVFHHVLLGICQCGDLRVVAWWGRGWPWTRGAHPQLLTALGWELPWVRHWALLLPRPPSPGAGTGCCFSRGRPLLGQALGTAFPEATLSWGSDAQDMKAWPCLDLGEPPPPQDLELPWEQQGLNSGHKPAPHPPKGCPAGVHPMADSSVPRLLIFYFILESS